jgi:hypothetical protein
MSKNKKMIVNLENASKEKSSTKEFNDYYKENMYSFISEDKEFVSLEDALSYMPNDKKEWCMKIVNVLLDECLSGTGIDW